MGGCTEYCCPEQTNMSRCPSTTFLPPSNSTPPPVPCSDIQTAVETSKVRKPDKCKAARLLACHLILPSAAQTPSLDGEIDLRRPRLSPLARSATPVGWT